MNVEHRVNIVTIRNLIGTWLVGKCLSVLLTLSQFASSAKLCNHYDSYQRTHTMLVRCDITVILITLCVFVG